MLDEAVVEAETPDSAHDDADSYHEWLRRKVEIARAQMRAGLGIPHEKMQAEFAARRKQART